MQHAVIWFNNLFPSWAKESISLISGILDILSKLVIPVAIMIPIWRFLRNRNAKRALNRMAAMDKKVEEYKNSVPVLISVAAESICWLVATLSIGIIWIISLFFEPLYTKLNIDKTLERLFFITMEIIFFIGMFKFWFRVTPVVNIAYPRRYERYKSRKAKTLFKRARLSAKEKQEFTKRIGLTRVEHFPEGPLSDKASAPNIGGNYPLERNH